MKIWSVFGLVEGITPEEKSFLGLGQFAHRTEAALKHIVTRLETRGSGR
jgi:hypothetical protein